MNQGPRPTMLDPASAVVARARHSISDAGERLLRERLHRMVDEGGPMAVTAFSETLLPHLQAFLAALPSLVDGDAGPTDMQALRVLGTQLHESGFALDAVLSQGIELYERLLTEVSAHLRESDRALIVALNQISRALLLAGHGTLLAYHHSATSRLADLANSDSLTGLANRRYFDLRFAEELQRAQRTGRPLVLVLLDVDGLKSMNDTYGHPSGDQLLSAVATILSGQARGIDVAARIGGDEFAVLLPETDRAGAAVLLERLTRGVADLRIHGMVPGISAGLAVYPDDGATIDDLTAHADAMLYDNKRNGAT